MSLFFDLRVTTSDGSPSLGTVEIQRATHRDVAEPAMDAVVTYSVSVNGHPLGGVDHRYGDSPWTLVKGACDVIADELGEPS